MEFISFLSYQGKTVTEQLGKDFDKQARTNSVKVYQYMFNSNMFTYVS